MAVFGRDFFPVLRMFLAMGASKPILSDRACLLDGGGNMWQPNQSSEMRSSWQKLLDAWAVDPTLADRAFEDICRHYAEPSRFYHTLDHVESVLQPATLPRPSSAAEDSHYYTGRSPYGCPLSGG